MVKKRSDVDKEHGDVHASFNGGDEIFMNDGSVWDWIGPTFYQRRERNDGYYADWRPGTFVKVK